MENEERFVWIVEGHWEYEGSNVIKVFAAEADAEAFEAHCKTNGRAIGHYYDSYSITKHTVS